MTTEVLDNDPVETPRVRPIFGYYRQPNGYITVSVTSPMEKLHYLEEGWIALPQYGLFDMTTGYTADHPFETLFLYGGAKEMTLEQIIDCGFTIRRPQIPRCKRVINQFHKKHQPECWPAMDVDFPQLDGVIVERFPCFDTACKHSQSPNEFSTISKKIRHETVMHKEEKGDITTGNVLAEALVKGLSGLAFGQADKSVIRIPNIGFDAKQLKVLADAGIEIVGSTKLS